MTRAKWKGPYIERCNFRKKRINPKLWSRSSVIVKRLRNTIVYVHNGREFLRVAVTKEKIGFKFGEFSYTRKSVSKKKAAKHAARKKKSVVIKKKITNGTKI